MQPPTCRGIRVRSPADAERIFHGVYTRCLRMVDRRLDTEERRAIHSGCVYVWEERGSNTEAVGLGIERWTDSISWGPSRVRDEFLYYQEKRPAQTEPLDLSTNPGTIRLRRYRPTLIKQTYSVFVNTQYGQRKWHMIAYFTQETVDQLGTVDDHPALASLVVPRGMYRGARNPPRHTRSTREPRVRRRPPSIGSDTTFDDPETRPSLPRPRNPNETLAPLEYLETVAPPPRHAMDESAIMSFSAIIDSDGFTPRFTDYSTPQASRHSRWSKDVTPTREVEASFAPANRYT